MIKELPNYISIVFAITTLVTVIFFYVAARKSKLVLLICLLWMAIQAVLALTGFYQVTDTVPPRFALLIRPPTLFTILLFVTKRGRSFLDGLNTTTLTYLSIIRIPVEMVLFWLFLHNWMPEITTFEGQNFDIIAGITAPLVGYFGYQKKRLKKGVLITWNVICFLLLTNIVVTAVLAAPSAFQVLEWDKDSIGIMYFPFVWLPCIVVPIVFLSHLVNIRQLIKTNTVIK